MDDSSDRALAMGAKIIAAAAGKIAETAVGAIFTGGPLSPISAIAGPALGMAVKEFIEQLTAETSKLDAKLNLILHEPLVSACQTIREVLSARYRTKAEVQERERRLAIASDNLIRAYNYTEAPDAEHLPVIRIYQAVVAALMEGGRPFMELYIQDLSSVTDKARDRAAFLKGHAASIDLKALEERRGGVMQYALPEGENLLIQLSGAMAIREAEEQKKKLLIEAANLEKTALFLESLCSFILSIAEHRQNFFVSS
jgi:hypothetical protein